MDQPSRQDELMAAALAGELTSAEREELDAACAANPALLREIQSLQGLSQRLTNSGVDWTEHAVPVTLAQKMEALSVELSGPGSSEETASSVRAPQVGNGLATNGPVSSRPDTNVPAPTRPVRSLPATSPSDRNRRRYRRPLLAAAAAALLVIGGVGGAALSNLQQAPPTGPPGTLGAVEDVQLQGSPTGTTIDATLIAHTWGTETVLAIDGLPVGESYEVVLVRTDGTELDSGTFLGAAQTVTCRMNAAVLRGEVAALQIRSTAGTVLASSDLPRV